MKVGDRVISRQTGRRGLIHQVNPSNRGIIWVRWDGNTKPHLVFASNISPALELIRDDPAGENPKDRIGATKPDLSLVPPAGIIAVAEAMKDGANKYGAYNWREKKVQAMTYLAANMRHVLAYLDGEEVADDSGVKHLGHAAACLFILLDAEATGNLVDNRPVAGAASRLIKEGTREQ